MRVARSADLPALLDLEERCFDYSRIAPRAFRHLVTRAHAVCLVVQGDRRRIWGYGVMLLRRGSNLGRIYSLAVAPEARGRAFGKALLVGLEWAARRRGLDELRLEVKADNALALAMYGRAGWHAFGQHENYYGDGTPALRFRKRLATAKG